VKRRLTQNWRAGKTGKRPAGQNPTGKRTAKRSPKERLVPADEVMQRAKDAPGGYDIEFIGDSITQFWKRFGTTVWQEYYGHRKAINLGVAGDRTQHVLWRFDNGQPSF